MSLIIFAKKGTKERLVMSINFSIEQYETATNGTLKQLNKDSNEWEVFALLDNGKGVKFLAEDIN